jgi:hypothetical protein
MSHIKAGERSRDLSQSLIISPNLEALLEYEERVRGTMNQVSVGSSAGGSPQCSPQISSSPGGLPPPPRRRRKPQSPTSPQTNPSTNASTGFFPFSGITASLPSTPTLIGPLEPNPYINSPPSLEDILQIGTEDLGVIDEAETGTEAINTGPRDESNSADGRKRRRAHQRSRSSGDERALNKPLPPSANSSPTLSSKLRTDKFFNIKNTFGIFSDNPLPEVELSDVSNALLTPRFRQSSAKLGDRSLRIKEKLSKLGSGMSPGLRHLGQPLTGSLQVTLTGRAIWNKSARRRCWTFDDKKKR